MSHGFFDFEEEDVAYGVWGIKFPRTSDIRQVLFALEYTFTSVWAEARFELEENGLNVIDFIIEPKLAIDAISSGLIMPIYISQDSNTDQHMIYKFWSPLAHEYRYEEEMDEYEIEWFFNALHYGIWSYN